MQPIFKEHKIGVPTQTFTLMKHEKNMHEMQGSNIHKSPHFFTPKKPKYKNVFHFFPNFL
jgi:hypothetical protein